MDDLKREIEDVVTAINTVAELFYRQNQKEGYEKFAEIITCLSGVTEKIFISRANTGLPTFDESTFLQAFSDAVKALENKDTVLLADILRYDICDLLNGMKQQL